VAKPAYVETTRFLIFKQLIVNLEEANITKTGCMWLSKANWKQLTRFWLGIIVIIYIAITLVGRVADI
jgi:uncharacterized membrane protein